MIKTSRTFDHHTNILNWYLMAYDMLPSRWSLHMHECFTNILSVISDKYLNRLGDQAEC